MAYGQRDPGTSGDQAAYTYPVTRALAIAVLLALVFLAVLRFFYGSISIEAGTR